MQRLTHKLAGVGLAAGLALGAAAAVSPVAGASTLNLLNTTTTATASLPTGLSGDVLLTATVSLELLKGALVSPSGSVSFSAVNPELGGPAEPLGQATLSNCLLGLPPILGLWHETCTATLDNDAETAVLHSFCSPWTVTATYSSANDLIAKPSSGSTTIFDCPS